MGTHNLMRMQCLGKGGALQGWERFLVDFCNHIPVGLFVSAYEFSLRVELGEYDTCPS